MINFLSDLSEDFSYSKLKRSDLSRWMGVAYHIKDKAIPKNFCLSRQIGCVIVDPYTNTLISSGHNGPAAETPNVDDLEYLRDVVWPQLTFAERATALSKIKDSCSDHTEEANKSLFCESYSGCGECPRRLINAPSGQRLELCPCSHGETSSIVRAHRSVVDMVMICACGVPCIDCTKLILESRLAAVFCVVPKDREKSPEGDYSPYASRWLFEKSVDTDLYIGTSEWFDVNG